MVSRSYVGLNSESIKKNLNGTKPILYLSADPSNDKLTYKLKKKDVNDTVCSNEYNYMKESFQTYTGLNSLNKSTLDNMSCESSNYHGLSFCKNSTHLSPSKQHHHRQTKSNSKNTFDFGTNKISLEDGSFLSTSHKVRNKSRIIRSQSVEQKKAEKTYHKKTLKYNEVPEDKITIVARKIREEKQKNMVSNSKVNQKIHSTSFSCEKHNTPKQAPSIKSGPNKSNIASLNISDYKSKFGSRIQHDNDGKSRPKHKIFDDHLSSKDKIHASDLIINENEPSLKKSPMSYESYKNKHKVEPVVVQQRSVTPPVKMREKRFDGVSKPQPSSEGVWNKCVTELKELQNNFERMIAKNDYKDQRTMPYPTEAVYSHFDYSSQAYNNSMGRSQKNISNINNEGYFKLCDNMLSPVTETKHNFSMIINNLLYRNRILDGENKQYRRKILSLKTTARKQELLIENCMNSIRLAHEGLNDFLLHFRNTEDYGSQEAVLTIQNIIAILIKSNQFNKEPFPMVKEDIKEVITLDKNSSIISEYLSSNIFNSTGTTMSENIELCNLYNKSHHDSLNMDDVSNKSTCISSNVGLDNNSKEFTMIQNKSNNISVDEKSSSTSNIYFPHDTIIQNNEELVSRSEYHQESDIEDNNLENKTNTNNEKGSDSNNVTNMSKLSKIIHRETTDNNQSSLDYTDDDSPSRLPEYNPQRANLLKKKKKTVVPLLGIKENSLGIGSWLSGNVTQGDTYNFMYNN